MSSSVSCPDVAHACVDPEFAVPDVDAQLLNRLRGKTDGRRDQHTECTCIDYADLNVDMDRASERPGEFKSRPFGDHGRRHEFRGCW